MEFIELMFVNPVTAFISFDLLIAATAALIFIIFEGIRLNIKNYWISILLIFLVGVSLGFPLFLYMRENKLEKNNYGKK